MKSKIIMILFLLLLPVMAIEVEADKTIRVFGNVSMDGQPLENIRVEVKNLDRGFEFSTYTDSLGNYTVFTSVRDHEVIRVVAVLDNNTRESFDFTVIASSTEYEVNFEFESETRTFTVTRIVTLFEDIWTSFIGLFSSDVSLKNIILWAILIILIIFIIKLIFPSRNHRHDTNGRDKSDQQIILVDLTKK